MNKNAFDYSTISEKDNEDSMAIDPNSSGIYQHQQNGRPSKQL